MQVCIRLSAIMWCDEATYRQITKNSCTSEYCCDTCISLCVSMLGHVTRKPGTLHRHEAPLHFNSCWMRLCHPLISQPFFYVETFNVVCDPGLICIQFVQKLIRAPKEQVQSFLNFISWWFAWQDHDRASPSLKGDLYEQHRSVGLSFCTAR